MKNITKRKIKKALKEIHLCQDKTIMCIKVIAWAISWIGGILVLQRTEGKSNIGNAYFLFSIPLLMEFAPSIKTKKEVFSRIAHSLLCLALVVMFLLSVALLVGVELNNSLQSLMFGLSIFVMAYIVLDLLIIWLSGEDKVSPEEASQKGAAEELEAMNREFFKRLYDGSLGTVQKGEKNE